MLSEGLETLRAALLFYLPEIDAVIVIAPCQQLAILAESHRLCPTDKTLTWRGLEAVPAAYVTEAHFLIIVTTDERIAIDAEDEGSYRTGPAEEGRETLSTAHFPQLDLAIIITTGQQAPIGTEGHRPNHAGMPLQGHETVFTILPPYPPEFHRPIMAATGQQAPIGTESHRPDHSSMSVEGPHAVPT